AISKNGSRALGVPVPAARRPRPHERDRGRQSDSEGSRSRSTELRGRVEVRRVSRLLRIGEDAFASLESPRRRWGVRLWAGARVGPYEVLATLGAGGMGEVYRARDTRLGREVALKVISDGTIDPEWLQRFEQEARLAGSLNHPNLVVVHDVGSEGGAPFLVTELLEGESLRDRLSRGRLPLRTALDLGAQIAEGLAAAHARGIVHRDVKPENVFLTSSGRA